MIDNANDSLNTADTLTYKQSVALAQNTKFPSVLEN